MAKITKIALTGGPCSGKTSVIARLEKEYKNDNRDVFICPESATKIINAGVSRNDYMAFETAVAMEQLRAEKEIISLAEDSSKDEVVIFFDRALTDCFSYVDDVETLEKNIGVKLIESWSRYDAVIVLETAPKDDYINDSSRIESYEEAISFQNSLLDVMVGHPHLRFIKNANSLEEKYSLLKSEIDDILGGLELEKKYLIEYPNFEDLKKYKPFKAEISQTYLLSNIGSHRIRKRGANGVYSYFETLKIRVTNSCAEEIESIISKEEYEELMSLADPNKNTIIKDRYCFLYDGQYFELDIFPFWNDKAFLELELKDKNQEIKLPPEIKIIKDVSDDKHYKNNYLAGLKL